MGKKCQDDSKSAIDKLMTELKHKDKQILRISAAYRQQKEDLSKVKNKLSITESENASLGAEMKRSKSRVASISESLNLAQVLAELKKIKEENKQKDEKMKKKPQKSQSEYKTFDGVQN